MKTLTLSLKKQWFDLIKSGKKKEEYRKLNEYWIKRLLLCSESELDDVWDAATAFPNPTKRLNKHLVINECIKHFDSIVFTLGYPKADDTERRLEFKNPKIHIGTGKPEWGAEPVKNYFVISWEAA